MDEPAPQPDPARVLVRLRASPARRVFGVAVLGALGLLLLWLTLSQPATAGWRAVLGAAGILSLWGCYEIWRATAAELILTPEGLFVGHARKIALIDEIAAVDRGTFAFKPSNGFGLRLRTRGSFVWAPGLWWRFGHRVGVGGVTSAAQSKAMAETLSVMIAQRDGTI